MDKTLAILEAILPRDLARIAAGYFCDPSDRHEMWACGVGEIYETTDPDHAMVTAASYGYVAIVEVMIGRHATMHRSALLRAHIAGHRDMVELIVRQGQVDSSTVEWYARIWPLPSGN